MKLLRLQGLFSGFPNLYVPEGEEYPTIFRDRVLGMRTGQEATLATVLVTNTSTTAPATISFEIVDYTNGDAGEYPEDNGISFDDYESYPALVRGISNYVLGATRSQVLDLRSLNLLENQAIFIVSNSIDVDVVVSGVYENTYEEAVNPIGSIGGE